MVNIYDFLIKFYNLFAKNKLYFYLYFFEIYYLIFNFHILKIYLIKKLKLIFRI